MTESHVSISIGMQCTTSQYLKDKKLRSHSFPFDWLLSNPKFVFDILWLLLNDDMDINELVRDHFYVVDKKALVDLGNVEHYVTLHDPNDPRRPHNELNSKGGAIFPHDKPGEETIAKYVRRFERLKTLILDKNTHLDFYYVSQSSSSKGNFTIDGKDVVTDVFQNILRLHHLIKRFHGNKFRILVFDTLHTENPDVFITCSQNVIVHRIAPKNVFFELFPELMQIQV